MTVTRCLILLLATGSLRAQTVGPASGTLVLVGGAMNDPAILETFVELAGGPEAPVVVIPTAGSRDAYDENWYGLDAFRAAGLTDVMVLHTRDRAVADSDSFVRPLRTARGVWFTGGRQWRLADAYLGTEVERELWRLLERGGVIGGSSAGATIQGSYLVRGDTRTNTIMMGDHEEGFGFLEGVAIDQHLLKRNRHFDLLAVIQARPELLGLGIDENTAIVVQRDTFEVIGQGYVAIYDRRRMLDVGGPFYFLSPGDRFAIATRTPLRNGRPLQRVVEREWPEK